MRKVLCNAAIAVTVLTLWFMFISLIEYLDRVPLGL